MHLYNSQKVSISTIKQIFWIYQSLLIEGAGDANDNYLPYLILTNEQILNFPLGILTGGNRDGFYKNGNALDPCYRKAEYPLYDYASTKLKIYYGFHILNFR
uniref:Uncharacterized protein n=1 Tax=Rhizophagus irregularis (strain DAOM 181602 / DAOM 197198 / MUCL 43194) TaxID=747089 RepID=U9U7K7_RHIID